MKQNILSWFRTCHRWCRQPSVGILLLRIVVGMFFIAHGINKFQNVPLMVQIFDQWSFTSYWAYIVAGAELAAGIMMVLGVFVWAAAVLIAAIMAVAMWVVVFPATADMPFVQRIINGMGPHLIYGVSALTVAFVGAGRWSVSNWLHRRHSSACVCPCSCGAPEAIAPAAESAPVTGSSVQ